MSLSVRFADHIAARRFFPDGATVVVAYSGGADSTCLLTMLAEADHFDVVAAHLHHGQREEAEGELESCQGYCEKLGVPFVSGRANVPEMARLLGLSLEEAGRHARYTFLEQAARSLVASVIVTGHTLDDHVETVLMNLMRGTGLAGLGGIPEVRGAIVRPLLPFRRAETRAFCLERDLWFHDDPANVDSTHLRSRIRNQITPLIEEWEPAFFRQVERTAKIAEEEDTFLDGAAASLLERAEIPLNGELSFLTRDLEAQFDRNQLIHSPPVLTKRALRLAATFCGGPLDYRQTMVAHEGLLSGRPGSITTEESRAHLAWDHHCLKVWTGHVESAFRYPFPYPGELESEVFGYRLVAETAPSDAPTGRLQALIDGQTINGGLHIRSIQPGDRIRPAKGNGTKKISDLCQEHRLTSIARQRLPIICDMVGPVWVPGCAWAERAQVTQWTTRALLLTLEPLHPGRRQEPLGN